MSAPHSAKSALFINRAIPVLLLVLTLARQAAAVSPPAISWTVRYGTPGSWDKVDNLIADSDGVYVADSSWPYAEGTPEQIFSTVARFDRDGNLIWRTPILGYTEYSRLRIRQTAIYAGGKSLD